MDPNASSLAIPAPPEWSLTLGTVGKGLVIAAVAFYLLATIASILGPRLGNAIKVGKIAFQIANTAILGTFACLAALFVNNRFEFTYVWEHSDLKAPLQYRIAGIWSGQEGSFLLWASCSAIFCLIALRSVKDFQRWFVAAAAVFQGMIAAILAFETPFALNTMEGKVFVPNDGFGLSPALQNYWITIHPPVIFAGFGSLTVLFALAFAALMMKDYTRWVAIVRPYALVALALTGLGLCMGGFWAYETLGWGGFWMWDPVENVSFVPWCFTIALVHGIVVQAAKKKWQFTNLLLAGAPFLTFLYGTFLTRSGFLSDTSVHSFAEMDSSALKVLIGVMAIMTLGFTGLWATRLFQAKSLVQSGTERFTRDRWLGFGMWATVLMGLAAAIGMSVPLIMSLRGLKPSVVQEGLYHQVLPFIFIPLMFLMAVTPFLSWRKTDPAKAKSRMYSVLCISIGLSSLLLFTTISTRFNETINLSKPMMMLGRWEVNGLPWMMFLVTLCTFALVANVWSSSERWKRSLTGASGFLAHVGFTLLLAGLIISRGFESHGQAMILPDHPTKVLGYELIVKGNTKDQHDRNNELLIDVMGPNNKKLFTASPGLYKTTMGDGQESTMVWPHIQQSWSHDVYLALGQPQKNGTQDVTMTVGKTVSFGDLNLTYEKLVVDGEPGMAGTTFGAQIKVTNGEKSSIVVPKIELGGQGTGVVELPAELDENLLLVMSSMNAADKTVNIRIDFTQPIYPVEVYHKPLTSLVFIGTYFMTLAVLLSAYGRRNTVGPKASKDSDIAKSEESKTVDHSDRELSLSGKSK